ncbi:MAG: hypothetical protein JO360_00430, partial [Acidobacteria bacterium]|nr:hypothetical protein [Acidobacteriota bacterium]
PGEWRLEDGWISSCYGERRPAPVCTFTAHGTGAQEFYSFLLPRTNGSSRVSVRELAARGGRAFELRDAGTCDQLLAGGGTLIETQRLASDFKWAWARFEVETGLLSELVLIDGRRLMLDGLEILNEAEPVAYVTARRVDDRLSVVINDRIRFHPGFMINEPGTLSLEV